MIPTTIYLSSSALTHLLLTTVSDQVLVLMGLWSTQHDGLWSDQWVTRAWQHIKQDENGLELLMLPSVFTGQLPRQVRTYFHQALKVGFITCIFLSNFVNKTVQEDVVTNAKLFIQAADEVG